MSTLPKHKCFNPYKIQNHRYRVSDLRAVSLEISLLWPEIIFTEDHKICTPCRKACMKTMSGSPKAKTVKNVASKSKKATPSPRRYVNFFF